MEDTPLDQAGGYTSPPALRHMAQRSAPLEHSHDAAAGWLRWGCFIVRFLLVFVLAVCEIVGVLYSIGCSHGC